MANTVPPRYAIESDEEEDEINPLRKRATSKGQAPSEITLKLVGDVLQNKPLVIASARAGAFWAKGANLGEQTGAVYVNQIQPTWAHEAANVLISEPFTRLPLNFMHPYAKYVVEQLKPTRASLLDTYSSPTYSSLHPIPLTDAPIRYLSTEASQTPNAAIQPFSPPNLIQSTSAALLLQLRLSNIPSTLLLLPSPHLPIPPPKDLSPTNIPSSTSPEYEDTWPAEAMNIATDGLLSFVEVKPNEGFTWELKSKDATAIVSPKQRRSEIGEGGMYL
ncbi:hypothetical protein EST38_g10052 [Candolleomyces aberdarensis]|uniref:Uncharacterized protein n=1 Tax=Candolleomyces aberdarensis TaxID=2316362 RepID=A0A4V1Q2P5_9AGAR|nr:hypothetical protein EST38_g10052 [Candolleomyces aberdarensis]